MKIYNAMIYDHEVDDTSDVILAVLDTDKEKQLHDHENYDGLFKNLGYEDDDVFYYIDSSEIPAENNNEIRPGDKYDFFEIKTAELIASC